jgi:peroxiredoxin
MDEQTERRLVKIGDAAPTFSLPAVDHDGTVSPEDYLGKTGLLLGMIRGIYCSYCRRTMVQLSDNAPELRAIGVETLVVVTTPVERARVYAEFYPQSLPLVSDPEMTVHQAYGLPMPELTDTATDWPVTVNPNDISDVVPVYTRGEISEPMPLGEVVKLFDVKDGFQPNEEDDKELEATWNQLSGLVLVDKTGIVRWLDIEAPGGFADWGHIANNREILAAAQGLAA